MLTNASCIVEHHLRLFGITITDTTGPIVLQALTRAEATLAKNAVRSGRPVIALQPSQEFLDAFDVQAEMLMVEPPSAFKVTGSNENAWSRVRTLHKAESFSAAGNSIIEPIVIDENDQIIWAWHAIGKSGILFVGTDLAGDLIRYRQGDPAMALTNSNREKWGYSGERPNYLFDAQLRGENRHERHADWWVYVLRSVLVDRAGLATRSILPNGVPGVIIVTGDDDAALLEHYEEQCALLDPVPITYFSLQSTSCLDMSIVKDLSNRFSIEWELHPDALEAPDQYGEKFSNQAEWFEELTGKQIQIVRNHGFLNDGYWGHLSTWCKHGIKGSSNIPGFDGQVLNGSLLPARVSLAGELTEHWSLLTLFGDGIIFTNEWTDEQAAEKVLEQGKRILGSRVPGVMCLNLHPVNINKTRAMHSAVHDLMEEGFIAMTFSDLLSWFQTNDRDDFSEHEGQPIKTKNHELRSHAGMHEC